MTTVTNKNGVEFDIDTIATDLNGKMDVDGTNAILSETFISLFMPDYENGVEWNTNTPFTTYGFLYVHHETDYSGAKLYNSLGVNYLTVLNPTNGGAGGSCMIPVRKGDYYDYYWANDHLHKATFYPMKGLS